MNKYPVLTLIVIFIFNCTLFCRCENGNRSNGHNHEYVDLGLPSGTLWAKCNVGANKPEDYGDYFAWGETDTKENFTWYNYSLCNGNERAITKYCTISSFGYNGLTDKLARLQSSEDVATINWGNNCRIPTGEDFDELIHECDWKWIGKGYKVIGKNGNSIFLPAAGRRGNNEFVDVGEVGAYWSSSLNAHVPKSAWGLFFVETEGLYAMADGFYRFSGLSVRPVCVPTNNIRKNDKKTKEEHDKIPLNGYESVDLGLPSGTQWATCNVGASNPTDDGDYFAWGETQTKSIYNYDTYTYSSEPTTLPASADAATVNWGRDWRMPTQAEFEELKKYCNWIWISDGYMVIGQNGNSIFLPAAGFRYFGSLNPKGSSGHYWTSSINTDNQSIGAWGIGFDSDVYFINIGFRDCGFSIRPVRVKSGKNKHDANPNDRNRHYGNTNRALNGHEWVDLGLSVKWATCNVGANKPKDFGNYYAWGETRTKSTYSYESYAFPKIEITQLPAGADAATVNWGSGWRMPTNAELEELQNRCDWEWKGDGYKVTGPNGNSIFLPAAGYRMDDKLNGSNSVGYYWSSSACNTWPRSVPYAAWYLFFGDGWTEMVNFVRDTGCSIRPVCTK